MPRTIAIGDIHGHAAALAGLLDRIQPSADDRVVALGDYIDRGPDSRGVIDHLIDLGRRCELITLRGNHEQMMLEAKDDFRSMVLWNMNGGEATLDSYRASIWEDVPADHIAFIKATPLFHETESAIFVHANYLPSRRFEKQDPDVMLWDHLFDRVPGPHISGKTVFVGHTPMQEQPFDVGHLICLDTGCGKGGPLTAMDIDSRETWQVDETGRPLD